MLINFPFIEKSHIYYVRMRNPKSLKTGPEFYKTQIFLEDSLLILTNIQTWVNYRLYSQDLANLVQENIGFNFKTVYQMFRFLTRFLPESRKFWRAFLILLCLILYGRSWLSRCDFDLTQSFIRELTSSSTPHTEAENLTRDRLGLFLCFFPDCRRIS